LVLLLVVGVQRVVCQLSFAICFVVVFGDFFFIIIFLFNNEFTQRYFCGTGALKLIRFSVPTLGTPHP
jgi:hypothetical protein